jgi:hypothetical protein
MNRYALVKNILSALVFIGILQSGAQAPALSFSNTKTITIPAFGNAILYPSTTTTSGLSGRLFDINVALIGLSHTLASEIGILLVGPGGQKVVLMHDVGGFTLISNVNMPLDDQALASLPFAGGIPSDSDRPANFSPSNMFLAPARRGPYGPLLSAFNNTSPNETSSLFTEDCSPGQSGNLNGGWKLRSSVLKPSTLLLLGICLISLVAWLRREPDNSSSETQCDMRSTHLQ